MSSRKYYKKVEEEYTVEDIVDLKLVNGQEMAYVKWDNYSSDENTWEPMENLCNDGVMEMVAKCKKRKAKLLRKKPSIVEDVDERDDGRDEKRPKLSDDEYIFGSDQEN